MPYNETFEKLKAAQNPAFAEEIEAVKDNQTFFIGAYESSPEGNIPKGDFNEIFQALLNNDKALKKLAEAIQARTITAGKGLQGGGNLTANRTIDVVSADDSITVGADNIKVNTYNGVDNTSTTRPASANAVKQANDNANGRVSKTGDEMSGSLSIKLPQTRRAIGVDFLDYQGNDFGAIGAVTSGNGDGSLDVLYWGIGNSPWTNSTNNKAGIHMKDNNINLYGNVVSKLAITAPNFKGNADTATKLSTKRNLQIGSSSKEFDGSSDVSWTLSEIGAQSKTDNSLETESKDIVPAINESLWKMKAKKLTSGDNLDNLFVDGYYGGNNGVLGLPANANEQIKSGRFVIFVLNSRSEGNVYEGYLKRQILFGTDGNNEIWTRYTGGQSTYREWVQVLTSDNRLFLGNAGISKVVYIQDAGTKTKGYGYIDKDTGKIYTAKETNTDVTVTSKFKPADNVSNSYPLEYTNGIWFVREYKDYVELSTTQKLNYNTSTYEFELPFSLYFEGSIVLSNSCDTVSQNLISATIQNKSNEIETSNLLRVKRWRETGTGNQYFSFYIRGKKA